MGAGPFVLPLFGMDNGLAFDPGSLPRGALAARFWPEARDTGARASLRNSLWALRRALGPEAAGALATTRERVELDGAWLDAAEFGEHLTAGRLDDALAL